MKKKYIIMLLFSLIIISIIYTPIVDKIVGIDKNILELYDKLTTGQSKEFAYILDVKYKEMLFLASNLAILCGVFINHIINSNRKK